MWVTLMDDIIILTEDDLDDLFEAMGQPEIPHGMVSGRNIKTGSYGLFLCALDNCSVSEEVLLRTAISVIECISDSVTFGTLGMYYPPETLSHEAILNLSEAFCKLGDWLSGVALEDVSLAVLEAMDNEIESLLGVPDRVCTIKGDNDDKT